MNDDLSPEQRFAAEDAEASVPRDLMKGRDPEQIIAELIRHDWSPSAAHAMVARAADDLRRYHESPQSNERLVKEALAQLVIGVFIAIVGAGGTGLTVLGAIEGRLPYFGVAGFLVLLGLVLATRGWARWRLYRKRVLPFDELKSADTETGTGSHRS